MFMVNLEHISYVENDSTNTGAGRAAAIKADLESHQLGTSHIQEYFVSGCFDGQYILGDIENKLRELLKLPPEYDCLGLRSFLAHTTKAVGSNLNQGELKSDFREYYQETSHLPWQYIRFYNENLKLWDKMIESLESVSIFSNIV